MDKKCMKCEAQYVWNHDKDTYMLEKDGVEKEALQIPIAGRAYHHDLTIILLQCPHCNMIESVKLDYDEFFIRTAPVDWYDDMEHIKPEHRHLYK